MYAVSKLIIPGLVDQLNSMKNIILPNLLTEHPQVRQSITCMEVYYCHVVNFATTLIHTFINTHIASTECFFLL
jgi:hypothetical protein